MASSTESSVVLTVYFYLACVTLGYSVTVWLFLWFFNEWGLLENRDMLKHLVICLLLVLLTERLRFIPASDMGVYRNILLGVVPLLISRYLIRTYHKYIRCEEPKDVDMTGKVTIITGANSGIGREVAKAFVKMGGHRVIFACRNIKAAEIEMELISKELEQNGIKGSIDRMEAMKLDLNDLASVRDFVSAYRKLKYSLDVLVCNAAVMNGPRRVSANGFEQNFAVNYLGHFLLTNELLSILKKSSDGRVVFLGSSVHHQVKKLDFDNLMMEHSYSMFESYGRSKLAMVMYCKELARRLENQKSSVLVNMANPGVVLTSITKSMPVYMRFFDSLLKPLFLLLRKQPEHGAFTVTHVATSPLLRSKETRGQYFSNCALSACNKAAFDSAACQKLWKESEALIARKK
eukprot:197382_1